MAATLVEGLAQRRPVVVHLVLHESFSVVGCGGMLLGRRSFVIDIHVA